MLGITSKAERTKALVEQIRQGEVRVYITLTASGYETEIWGPKGPPLEKLVRDLIGQGVLTIGQRSFNSAGPLHYSMKLSQQR